MLVLTENGNKVKIFASLVEDEALKQIREMATQEWAQNAHIRIMPDVHAGAGCTIGTTFKYLGEQIVPNVVGVDIGCGVLGLKTKINARDVDFAVVEAKIKNEIPLGFNVRDNIAPVALELLFQKMQELKCIDDIPDKFDYWLKSVGTLGGGNHYIELGVDKDKKLWVTIHTGSRNFGLTIAKVYQEKAKQECVDKDVKKGLEYLSGQSALDYIHDMQIAQTYADINRMVIMNTIERILRDGYGMEISEEYVRSVHNYISPKDWVVRKGAISAHKGEMCLIPLNMRDGVILARGLGNPDWNYSAPHGAGRLFSRSEAKKTFTMEEFEQSMQGIYTTSLSEKTLDESPMAYKPMEEIVNKIQDTVEILDIIKPLVNIKG